MRKRIALLAAVLMAAACAADHPVYAGAERERLEIRQGEFLAAMSDRDADRTAAFFADGAVLHVANMPPVAGRAAIQRFYGNLFGYLAETRAAPETTHLSASGDMAYSIGTASNTFRGPQGTVEYSGKFVLVWRKLEGEWMIELYGVSSNQSEGGR